MNRYTLSEEIWSSSIHALGVFLSVAQLTLLVTLSSIYGDPWAIVSCSIFGASMIFMFLASSFYHAITKESVKKALKKVDHIAIYYLIAGSYTPLILANMRNSLGIGVLISVWVMAILGTILKLTLSANGAKWWSITLYLIMGWAVVFASKTLFAAMPTVALVFLILGGLFYTFGVLFYIQKKKKYTHAIWHGFVLMGALMIFFSVLFSATGILS